MIGCYSPIAILNNPVSSKIYVPFSQGVEIKFVLTKIITFNAFLYDVLPDRGWYLKNCS